MGERWRKFFDEKLNPFIVPNSKGVIRKPLSKDLKKILSTADERYVDLVIRCLEYDPQTRMTPEDALNHPWILEIYQKVKQVTRSSRKAKNSR
jgi:serine/threonine protein kinase